MLKDYLCIAFGVCGSFVIKHFGGWDESLTALILFMCIDYIMGIIVASVFHKSRKTENGGLDSHAGWKGLCRKGVTLLFVIVGNELDVVAGTDYIRNAVIMGFIANEVISIVENAGLMGIELPPVITKAIEVLQQRKANEK